MVRRKNEETIAAVQAAAREIMLESGYEAASYSAIAERAGIARTTVQHYFPSKEMFATSLMNDVAALSLEYALANAPADASSFAIYYLTAQTSYGIFYLTDGLRKFLLDMVVSRDLQHSAAPDYIAGAVDILGMDMPDSEDLFDIQYAIGGIYEMHYIFLRDGRVPQLAYLVRALMRILARMLDIDRIEYDHVISEYTLTNEELFEIGRKLIGKL